VKGSSILIDRRDGRSIAARLVDGRLDDLLIDAADDVPRIGAIYRAKVSRLTKGLHGAMLDMGAGHGFLKAAKGLREGQTILVQVASISEPGKAPPVTTRLLFKSRYAIVTPDAPGLNVARSIHDEDERVRLLDLAQAGMQHAPDGIGLILRSGCAAADDATIQIDIAQMLGLCVQVVSDTDSMPALLLDAPDAATQAWIDWDGDAVIRHDGCFADHSVWDMIADLSHPLVRLAGGATMFVEPTRAVVAVDVNTGGDFSPAAGLKANLAAAKALPRALRLRGLGGQIAVDFAPMAKKDRRLVEQALRKSLRLDGIDTVLAGWTPLGHLELQRKRARRPLAELL